MAGPAAYGPAMASGYHRGRRLRPEDLDRWMAAARPYLPAAGGRILDLGAGTGRFTGALARATGATVVACEPSAAMRAAFRAGTALVGGAAEAMPFRAGAFGAVWADGESVRLSLDRITAALAAAGLTPAGHVRVEQVLAADRDELVAKVECRSLSNLARLPEDVFRQGLRELRRATLTGPIVERLDLVAFRAG